jgi:hypothetical protein
MVVGMYREMPGLRLHLRQAVRLFGVAPQVCRAVFDELVTTGELHRMEDGQYRLREWIPSRVELGGRQTMNQQPDPTEGTPG